MKISKHLYLDNIIFYLQKAGGISVYWYELQKRLIERNCEITVIEQNIKSENIFYKLLPPGNKRKSLLDLPFFKLLRYFPILIKLGEGGILHSSYYRVSWKKNIINIITVYDFTYEYYRSGIARWIHSKQKYLALKKADGIICISDNTRKDLLEFFPDLHVKDIRVIHIAASDEFYKIETPVEPLNKFLLDKPFILFVGDRKAAYKNFKVAVEVVYELKNYNLVFVGGGKLQNDEEKKLDEKLNDRYLHYQNLESKDLNKLYNMAFCLLYPTQYEGFGIPILEAMQAGCPVVSTNISSIPEVAGEAALLVDKTDKQSFKNKILLLENKECKDHLVMLGLKQSKKFSWDKCFNETYQYYDDLQQEI